ncbi:MAG TPA: hypothetical protein VK144_07865 [Bacillota bacterium]|nr:hypothetical protein [Bacillota bacterium]
MGKRTLYFLFTDTGTNLSRLINFFTRESLNHVSIAFDKELSQVYSFGRKRPRNPFIGGFVNEKIRGEFLRDSSCAVYTLTVTEEHYEMIKKNIQKFEERREDYRYNFLGLIGILFHIEIDRKNAYFCSQFIATIMEDTKVFELAKPYCFVTPADIRNQQGMELIYEGVLRAYNPSNLPMIKESTIESKSLEQQSFIFSISQKVKQFVIR